MNIDRLCALKYFFGRYQIIVVVVKRRKGVLQNVWGVSQKDERQNSSIHTLGIIHPFAKNGILKTTVFKIMQ